MFHLRGIVSALTGAVFLASSAWSDGLASRRFEHLTADDGLSLNHVTWIHQDSDGFAWIATPDGLNRWDGHDVRVHQLDPDDPSTLSGNLIGSVMEDSRGDLWVTLGAGGVERMDRRSGECREYSLGGGEATGLIGEHVLGVHETSDGRVWFRTERGLSRLDPETDRFDHFAHDPADPASLPHSHVTSVLEDGQGRTWLGTLGGLARLEAGGRFVRHSLGDERAGAVTRLHRDAGGRAWAVTWKGGLYRHDASGFVEIIAPLSEAPPWHGDGRGARFTVQDERGRLWILPRGGGLQRLDMADGRVETLQHPEDSPFRQDEDEDAAVVDALVGRTGRLWVATRGAGLYSYDADADADRLVHLASSATDPEGLSSNATTFLMQDRAGLIWVGTRERGVNILDPSEEALTLVRHDPGRPDGLANATVTSFAEWPAGVIWVGTAGGGLHRWDVVGGVMDRVPYRPGLEGSLVSQHVNALLVDGRGRLWVGTDQGLAVTELRDDANADVRTLLFEHFAADEADPAALPGPIVLCLAAGSGDSLWVGTESGGLARLDKTIRQFRRYRHSPDDDSTIPSDAVWSVLEDRQGSTWVGTPAGGLARLDPVIGRAHRFERDPEDRTTISDRTVNSLLEDSRGRLWVGTHGGGLNRVDLRTGEFSHFTMKDGLPNNVINGLVEDGRGRLWLATNRGLAMFDPETRRTRSYDVHDGLQGGEFRRGAAFVDSEGALLFGGPGGLNRFLPERLRDNEVPPPVAITAFRHQAGELPLDPDVETRLSWRDDLVSFEFAALDFTNPRPDSHAYMLEGFDRSWVQAGTRRHASYTNLAPGRYVFRVIAANDDGVWNEAGASIAFSVVPPFWQAAWFRSLAACALLALVVRLHVARVRRMREPDRELEEGIVLETRDLREDDLAQVLRARARHHQRVASTTGIRLDVAVPEQQSMRAVMDPARIGEVLDYLLGNAIGCTRAGGEVRLEAESRDDEIVVRVTCAGQGLDEEDLAPVSTSPQRLDARPSAGEDGAGLGPGLAMVRKVVELHGGRTFVESEGGPGSTFGFSLPAARGVAAVA